ncbi:hypothetical protein [Streptomyces sp. NPDC029674]|uniref:hypothetical protein n=1 Tax=Streptomyces sp. NPDC029674 TaxID=3365297 RepID=UPI00384E7BCB
MGEPETWTSEEFGTSHEGKVGVLLADGTEPDPVVYPSNSGAWSSEVAHWSVYDGQPSNGPRAAVLRAVCSCGWTGPEQPLNWKEIGDQPLRRAADDVAGTCVTQWDHHIEDVDRSAIALPTELAELMSKVEEQIEKLPKDAALVALRAARRMEVQASRLAYWPAHDVRRDTSVEEAAAALGLNVDDTRALLARFGNWSRYA